MSNTSKIMSEHSSAFSHLLSLYVQAIPTPLLRMSFLLSMPCIILRVQYSRRNEKKKRESGIGACAATRFVLRRVDRLGRVDGMC
jgi:hypothetical protein